VVQRAAFAQRHADHLALGLFGRLADRLGHLAGLALAEAHAALLVADDDERGKAEALAALHGLGDAVDRDEAIRWADRPTLPDHRGAPGIGLARGACTLEFQAALAGGIGQRLDAAVEEEPPGRTSIPRRCRRLSWRARQSWRRSWRRLPSLFLPTKPRSFSSVEAAASVTPPDRR
jgi:hypothetical protein